MENSKLYNHILLLEKDLINIQNYLRNHVKDDIKTENHKKLNRLINAIFEENIFELDLETFDGVEKRLEKYGNTGIEQIVDVSKDDDIFKNNYLDKSEHVFTRLKNINNK